MFVQQFFVKGIAHSSYLLGGTTTCAIVDPRRDIGIYLDAAKEMGMKITHILETHLHADFISGHLDLAEATGAVIYAPKSAKCQFKHKAVAEGDTFKIENMHLRVLETPGHTPEHISYVVTDTSRGSEPVAVFCGDTLFVGDVGRPDLFPGIAEQLANKLYDSLYKKLMTLPDFCEVYPAHGAGSLCGRAMGAKRTSTIGYERKYNSALQISDREAFIKSLTTNMPAAPDHFSRCSAVNGKGPALVRELPEIAPMAPIEFKKAAQKKNTIVLDIRSYEAFGGQHVPGAYHIDFGGNFATFAGWILPPDQNILLVADSLEEAREAGIALKRVGLDKATGYLDGGMFAWAKEGFPMNHVPQLSSDELNRIMAKGKELSLIDVRATGEFQMRHIEGAVNIPAPDMRSKRDMLKKSKPIALICSTGHRSSLAAALLKQKGFEDVSNVAGGMTGYSAAGYSEACPICVAPHIPRADVE
ncbi:MAG: rhodanese-like domain-containing protein [Acidobacteriota bacterium]|jgi:glyoxylase-like metal-dependent hydrolase (beta-lactamase superfamily II)/rhodanese-related sulfurtransferase|nr:rhodanese-like domain-containing protein [Acidobacteriota bacterium]